MSTSATVTAIATAAVVVLFAAVVTLGIRGTDTDLPGSPTGTAVEDDVTPTPGVTADPGSPSPGGSPTTTGGSSETHPPSPPVAVSPDGETEEPDPPGTPSEADEREPTAEGEMPNTGGGEVALGIVILAAATARHRRGHPSAG